MHRQSGRRPLPAAGGAVSRRGIALASRIQHRVRAAGHPNGGTKKMATEKEKDKSWIRRRGFWVSDGHAGDGFL